MSMFSSYYRCKKNNCGEFSKVIGKLAQLTSNKGFAQIFKSSYLNERISNLQKIATQLHVSHIMQADIMHFVCPLYSSCMLPHISALLFLCPYFTFLCSITCLLFWLTFFFCTDKTVIAQDIKFPKWIICIWHIYLKDFTQRRISPGPPSPIQWDHRHEWDFMVINVN